MQVKVKIFEDYNFYVNGIKSFYICPVGNYQEKILTDNDIRNALKQFLNIKNTNDVISFAKKYGLLCNYDFTVKFVVGLGIDRYNVDISADANMDTDCTYDGCCAEIVDTRNDIYKKSNQCDKKFIKNTLNNILVASKSMQYVPPFEITMHYDEKIGILFYDSDKRILMHNLRNNNKIYFPTNDYIWFYNNDKTFNDSKGLFSDKNENSGKNYANYMSYLYEKTHTKGRLTADYFRSCICELVNNKKTKYLRKHFWFGYQKYLFKQRSLFNSIYDRNKTKK